MIRRMRVSISTLVSRTNELSTVDSRLWTTDCRLPAQGCASSVRGAALLERVAELQESLGALRAVGDVEPEEHSVPGLEPKSETIAALDALQAEAGVVPGLSRVVEAGQLESCSDFETILRGQGENLVAAETEARIAPHRERAAQCGLEVEGHVAARPREALGRQEARGQDVPAGAERLVPPSVERQAGEAESAPFEVRVTPDGQAHEVALVGVPRHVPVVVDEDGRRPEVIGLLGERARRGQQRAVLHEAGQRLVPRTDLALEQPGAHGRGEVRGEAVAGHRVVEGF